MLCAGKMLCDAVWTPLSAVRGDPPGGQPDTKPLSAQGRQFAFVSIERVLIWRAAGRRRIQVEEQVALAADALGQRRERGGGGCLGDALAAASKGSRGARQGRREVRAGGGGRVAIRFVQGCGEALGPGCRPPLPLHPPVRPLSDPCGGGGGLLRPGPVSFQVICPFG